MDASPFPLPPPPPCVAVACRQRQAAAAAHWRALAALLGPMLLDGTGLSGVAWEPAVAQALAQHAAACAAAVPGLCRDVRLPALLSTLLRDLARVGGWVGRQAACGLVGARPCLSH